MTPEKRLLIDRVKESIKQQRKRFSDVRLSFEEFDALMSQFDGGFHAGWEAAIEEALVLLESYEDKPSGEMVPFVRALAT